MSNAFRSILLLTVCFALVLVFASAYYRTPQGRTNGLPGEHPYYLALKKAECVWHSAADDDSLAAEQARELYSRSVSPDERDELFAVLSYVYPLGGFFEGGIDLAFQRRLVAALLRIDESYISDPRIGRLQDSFFFGKLSLVVRQENGRCTLDAEIKADPYERLFGSRQVSITAGFLGTQPSTLELSFPSENKGVQEGGITPTTKVRVAHGSIDLGEVFDEDFPQLCVSMQYRFSYSAVTEPAQPEPMKDVIELKRVKYQGEVRYLPRQIVENRKFEIAVGAILQAMHEHELRKEAQKANAS